LFLGDRMWLHDLERDWGASYSLSGGQVFQEELTGVVYELVRPKAETVGTVYADLDGDGSDETVRLCAEETVEPDESGVPLVTDEAALRPYRLETEVDGRAVACGFNAEGGTRNFSFSTRETHSPLYRYLTVGRTAYPRDGFFLRAESFYNVATNIDEMDEEPGPGGRVIDSYGGVSLHRQSHGESFLSLVEHRFGGQGLYLLDEPEAALSPSRLMTLLVHIRHLVGQDSQFLIATHSPILMAYPGACIYQLSEAGIARVDYRDTEHYRLTRRFLEAPERMMELLFQEL